MSSTHNSNDLIFVHGEVAAPVRHSIEIVSATTPSTSATNVDNHSPHYVETALMLLSIVVTMGFSFFAYLDYRKQLKPSLLPIKVRTSPCRSCRYFHRSSQLKCAVHPTSALTPEAENCVDCEPNNNEEETSR